MKKYHSKKYLIEQLKSKDYIQIAKENKIDNCTIQRWMRRYHLTSKYIYWSEKEIKLLKENYEINPNVYKLFSNRTTSSINHKASKLGIPKIVRKRIYSLNHNFFEEWSPEMAYILGFFFSDGNVSSDKKSAGIHLHKNDSYILERIRKIIGSDRPIGIYTNSSYLRLDSKVIAKDLINLGCTPRKSLTLKFPSISDEFLSHFVRGYFDGDGSIHFNKPNTIKISFVGTKKFLEELRCKLNRVLRLKKNDLYKDRTLCILRYYSDDARNLCNWIYKNPKGLYLKRKKDRFDKHMGLRNDRI